MEAWKTDVGPNHSAKELGLVRYRQIARFIEPMECLSMETAPGGGDLDEQVCLDAGVVRQPRSHRTHSYTPSTKSNRPSFSIPPIAWIPKSQQ
jgi:hypothetical protein